MPKDTDDMTRAEMREAITQDLAPLLAAGLTTREAGAFLMGVLGATQHAEHVTGQGLSAREAFHGYTQAVIDKLGPNMECLDLASTLESLARCAQSLAVANGLREIVASLREANR